MGYYFELKPAMACGVDGAVMLSNLKFWIDKNRANEKHFHDGRYWTYNSVKAFEELFPFWSKGQISTILNRLEKQNYIVSGNYNKSAYDRTKWYALTDKAEQLFGDYGMQNFSGNGTSFSNSPISQNQEMDDLNSRNAISQNQEMDDLNSRNAISQNQEMDDLNSRNEFLKIEKPIPYNKPYNKQTDNKQPYNKQTDNKQTDNIKENNKKKTPNESALIEKQLEEYANGDEELLMLLHEWLKCRKAKRLVATEFAIKTNLKKIDRMAKASNLTVKEYLEEVICRGWGAFYPINDFNNSYQRKNKIDLQPTKSEEPTNSKDEIITEGTFKGWTVGKLEEERRKAGERYRAEMERRKKEQENNLC